MSEWISVEDRFPEIPKSDEVSDFVVVCNANSKYEIYIATIDRKGRWCENSSGCGCCADCLTPTHWMLLPVLPEVKDD